MGLGAGMSKTYAGYKQSGEPIADYWIGQLRKGLEFRKKAAYESQWKNWLQYYRGDFSDDVLPVNIIFKMIRTIVPRTYFRDPTVSITQEKPGELYAVMAQMLERIDNKLIRQMKYKKQMKIAIQDACLFGTGFLKLGFGAERTPTPDAIETEAPMVKKGRDQYEIEYHSLVFANMPWVLRVHPRNIVFPDKCVDFAAARWVAHIEQVHIDDLRNDPRFKNVADIQTAKPVQNTMDRSAKVEDLPEGYVQIVEFRDKKSGKVFVIAPYHSKKVLLVEDDTFTQEHNRFPIYPIVFNADTDRCWGVPDAKILDPQQRELNEIRTQEMLHRRHAVVKLLFQEDSISPDEMEKMDSSDVGACVKVTDINAVRPMAIVNAIPTGLIEQDQNVQREVQELIGLGSNQFGEYAPGSADRSATEANIVNQATQIRMDERRDAVADVTEDIFQGVHSIIFEHWNEEQVVDIVGDNGATFWVKVQPEYLRNGTYDINIDPDTGLPMTAQLRKANAVQTYQMLSQNPKINQDKLLNMLLRELHGAEYDDLVLTPQEQQKMQQAAEEAQRKAVTMQEFAKANPLVMAQRQAARAQKRGRR